MNIHFQVFSLLIIALIFVIYATHKRLMLRGERVFNRTLFMGTFMLLIDLAAAISFNHLDVVPAWVISILCKAMETLLIFSSGAVFVYLKAEIVSSDEFKKINKRILPILTAEAAVMCFFPLEPSSAGYPVGAAIHAGYGFFAINFSITLLSLAHNYKKINKRKRFGIVLWIFIWMSLTLTEMYIPKLFLVSLAMALGLLVLFALLEKPEAKLDRLYGCFNYFALIGFLDEMVESKTNISLISVSLKTSGSLTGEKLHSAAQHVLQVLERSKDLWIFRGINQDFICLSKKKEVIEKVSIDLEVESKLFPKISSYARITRCYDVNQFSSADEILNFMGYAKKKDNEQNRIFDISIDLTESFQNKKEIEVELRKALIENRVETFFQPIYSTKEKKITSCEALARIRKKDGSILMPNDFIPVAEENGSILELGYKIFEQVCEFIYNYPDIVEYVEVNLSVVQCEDETMADKLIDIMNKYKVSPQKINLEITETASIITKQKLLKNMECLLEHGITFSLDDFGKGESNLMYVVDMPISIVKLDFDMSKSYFKNDKAKYVVNAVEGMSHGLNLKLVAEGIESAEELKAMEKQNIDYIQGYYFSKPLPSEDFVKFVEKYNGSSNQQ